MNPEVERAIEELRKQIWQNARTETECAKCLASFCSILLPFCDAINIYVNQEQAVGAGRVDLIMLADEVTMGTTVRKAYVWELKAPQLHLCQMETKDRACPTIDLLKAENQLLHYRHEVAYNLSFCAKWGILLPDHVEFGGIVMGRNDRLVKPKKTVDPCRAERAARHALQIRKLAVYKPNGMRLWTWEKVLTVAESRIASDSHQRITGDLEAAIDLKATERLSVTLPRE